MTQQEVSFGNGFQLGLYLGIAMFAIALVIYEKLLQSNKKIPPHTDPWAKLDETVANIEKNCNELDTLIDNLKKQRDERTRPN